jgi:hypothetical protein
MKPTSQLPTKIQQGVEIRSDSRDIFLSTVSPAWSSQQGRISQRDGCMLKCGKGGQQRQRGERGEGKGMPTMKNNLVQLSASIQSRVPVYCPVDKEGEGEILVCKE